MLQLKVKNFRNIHELDIELPIKKGVYAISGENGIGKSTILTILSKLVYTAAFNSYFKYDGDSSSEIIFTYKGKKNKWIKTNQ
ncbi:AAA family ATPase [Actinobacillus equuli subsp. equuli]|uniref:AAA family ATPase n=2 Tax=Actinobacillus equuli TaxID=718 RepID=A0A9X4G4C2_ACTEU|nr:AAA family ATPase [Actinobacillus equuli]MDE8035106.1 AAA family ATPase [Actinobacillus equuli subsp. equuli]